MLYRYARQELPGPGTGNYAFEPAFTLPARNIGGPGKRNRMQLAPLQHPQVYYNQSLYTSGLGGTISGGIVLQPLLVPKK